MSIAPPANTGKLHPTLVYQTATGPKRIPLPADTLDDDKPYLEALTKIRSQGGTRVQLEMQRGGRVVYEGVVE